MNKDNRLPNIELLTIEDLADYLKVTRRTIYDWLKHNKIPAVKLVGQWRFRKDKIDAWIDTSTKLGVSSAQIRSGESRTLH